MIMHNDQPPASLVERICDEAAGDENPGVKAHVDADPLDGTCWIGVADPATAERAVAALAGHGIAAIDVADTRIHTLGWNARLLRIRLGTLLAGVDDLTEDFDTTTELVCYHYDRRATTMQPVDPVEVIADVEAALRGALPLPRRVPSVTDIDVLRQLADAAEDAYQQLINEHIDHAEQVLAGYRGRHLL